MGSMSPSPHTLPGTGIRPLFPLPARKSPPWSIRGPQHGSPGSSVPFPLSPGSAHAPSLPFSATWRPAWALPPPYGPLSLPGRPHLPLRLPSLLPIRTRGLARPLTFRLCRSGRRRLPRAGPMGGRAGAAPAWLPAATLVLRRPVQVGLEGLF